MNDCPNAEMRDLLPDLVNDQLSASSRAAVEAHLAGCADCQAELALLRDVRGALRDSPAVDVAAIVGAIPAYRAPVRRSWVGWRTAAAITVLVAGGSSVVLVQREPSIVDTAKPVATVPSEVAAPAVPARADSAPPAVATSMPAPAAPIVSSPATPVRAERELAMGAGSLTDLSDRELDALLRDIESLDALPTTDVEATLVSPVAPTTPGRGSP